MRWLILSLLFVATTINYLDRALLGMILPEIRKVFPGLQESYGVIQFWFQIFYGVGALVGGKLLDRFGTRIGYGLAALLWSAVAMLNAGATSILQFGILRGLLGLGEAPNFPACNKAGAELFPPSQRALAMGVVNSGTNLANVIGPGIFLLISTVLGWRWCFAIMGALGLVWLPVWFLVYRVPKQAGVAIPETAKVSIRTILKYKQAWGYGWGP